MRVHLSTSRLLHKWPFPRQYTHYYKQCSLFPHRMYLHLVLRCSSLVLVRSLTGKRGNVVVFIRIMRKPVLAYASLFLPCIINMCFCLICSYIIVMFSAMNKSICLSVCLSICLSFAQCYRDSITVGNLGNTGLYRHEPGLHRAAP